MKKIVAHIQRTVTITTIKTAVDVLVSQDNPGSLAIEPGDPLLSNPNTEGIKNEQTENDPIRSHSGLRKPARRVRVSRPANGKLRRSNR